MLDQSLKTSDTMLSGCAVLPYMLNRECAATPSDLSATAQAP